MYVPKTEKQESKATTETEGRPSPVNYPGGNQAALSHLSAAPPQVSSMSNSVIQRMIGFEFQTVGGDWNIKEEIVKENGKGTEDVTPDPHFHKQENKFAITSDGCDLEYVTDPFDEKDTALLDTVELAAQTHLDILNGEYAFNELTPTKDPNVYQIKENDVNYIINKKGGVNAHPQATVGVRLEKLADFIEQAAKDETFLDYEYLTKKSASKQGVQGAVAAVSEAGMSDAKIKGFLTLVLTHILTLKNYLNSGGNPVNWLKNAKFAMPFMNRTDFTSLLNEITDPAAISLITQCLEPYRDEFIACQVVYSPHYIHDYNPDDVKKTTLMKYRITEDDSEVILRGFLVRDWLDALTSPSPADLLKGNFNSVSGMKGNTTGTLTRSSTDIGDWHIRDNEKIPDAILEMRQLKNNVQPGEWRDLAEKVVLLVTTANDISGISSGSPVSDSAPPLVPAVPGRRSKAIPDRVKSFIIPPAEGYTKAIYSNESPEHVLKLARSNKELFCSHLIKIDKCKKTLTKYQTDANSASKYNDIKPSITGFNSAVSTLKGLLNNEKYRNISILAHQYIANQGLPGADQDPEELLSKFKEYRINYIDRDKTLDGYRKSFFDTIHQKADSEVTSITKSLSDIRTQKNNHEKKITSDSQQLKDTTAHLTERNNASTLLTGLNRKLTNYKKEYEKLSAQQAALQSEYGTLRARFETPPAQKGTSLLSKKSAVISKPVKGKPGSHPVPIAAAPKPSAPVPSNPAPTPAVLTPAQKKQLTDLQKQIDTISEKLAANYTGQQALQREYDRISGDTTDQDMLQSQIKVLTDGIAACRKQLSDLKTKEKSQEAELAKWEKLLKKYS